jgi:glycolate oxidase FAD binding subunit
MSIRPNILSRLAGAVGADGVLSDPSQLGPYEVDGKEPAVVLFPADSQELGACLAAAASEGLAVLPRGSGSKLGLGGLLRRLDAVLCTSRLTGLVDYDPGNLSITVGAGTPLARVQEMAQAQGQFLPLDPPHGQRATVGGILAANSSGPRRLLYGSPRDLTLGLRVALPDGRIIKTGGKTVKNVAGYDLTKLFIGSLGTLGMIVEATLRLRPLPEAQRTLALSLPTLAEAGEAVGRILGSCLLPAALELADQRAVASIGQRAGLDLGQGPLLLVALEGFVEEVERQSAQLRAMPRSLLVLEDRSASLWSAISDFGLMGGVVCRVGLPIAAVAGFMEATQAGLAGLQCSTLAHAGSGIVWLILDSGDSQERRLGEAIIQGRALAQRVGGYLVVEEAPLGLKGRLDLWGPMGSAPVMRRIKGVLDPGSVLSPGRFVGGI